jgi:transcriptional regulator with XRE-family HTH domain
MNHAISIERLANELRKARAEKRLTQRDLSAKIRVPQSHISKIESGKVDLQASSLIELARALDLEVMLVPRNLVPAVVALNHPSPSTAENRVPGSVDAQTFDALEKARKEATRLSRKLGAPAEFTRFISAARDLERSRFMQPQSDQIQNALAQLKIPYDVLKLEAAAKKKPAHGLLASDQVRQALERYAFVGDQIRNIRNVLAHGAPPGAVKSIPAYRLSEGDDDA